MKQPILLIGGGGHCKALIDVIEQEGSYFIAGIIDAQERLGEKILGYEIIGCDDDLEKLSSRFSYAVVAIGQIQSPEIRIRVYEHLKSLGFILPSIVSPRAYLSAHATLGEGSVIMHDALVNANATIGKNCIINTKALIEHDAHVLDHCHISTGVILNGGTVIGEKSFIGSNSLSKEYSILGENTFIKAGSIIK